MKILKRIKERFPSNILLWPVAVQGNNSEQEIESAILGFNSFKKKPDVIILARGGGSLEDLMILIVRRLRMQFLIQIFQ